MGSATRRDRGAGRGDGLGGRVDAAVGAGGRGPV